MYMPYMQTIIRAYLHLCSALFYVMSHVKKELIPYHTNYNIATFRNVY